MRPSEFDRVAACERMRVDRNQSPLSILLITLPNQASRDEELRFLASVLARRLRMTDTPGLLRDGRVGVLLPDTPVAGAWKVAEDIRDRYDASAEPQRFEVLVYPDDELVRRGPAVAEEEPSVVVGVSRATAPASELFFASETPAWKRAIDVAGASLGLIVAGPVIVAAAAAVVATSRGGAFFAQEREGLGGRRFRMFKLRTMRQDAAELKDGLRGQSEQDGPAFKMTNDPRVTRVGNFLRKTSIDELPQLWNVLRGEMSLVGPRPLQVDESLACRPWQRRRLAIKPGLTCIWQVRGRSVVSFDEWIRMDLRYLRRRSWWTDLKLLLLTPVALLTTKGPR